MSLYQQFYLAHNPVRGSCHHLLTIIHIIYIHTYVLYYELPRYICELIGCCLAPTGPFAASEMAEWFSAGYFTMNLQVKRGCDDKFQPLGEYLMSQQNWNTSVTWRHKGRYIYIYRYLPFVKKLIV